MKNLLIFIFTIIVIGLASCDNKSVYRYIEVSNHIDIMGQISQKEGETKYIEAESDSAAYLEAYQKFIISKKVDKDLDEASSALGYTEGCSSHTIDFKLYDKQNIDIAKTTFFANKDSLEKDIEQKIYSQPNSHIKNIAAYSKSSTAKVDSTKIKELLPSFNEKKDEFDPNGKVWIEPKSRPKYTNMNGIYLYFCKTKEKPHNLRFRIQYLADDWLFFHKVQFSIDGKAYEYIPSSTEHDHGVVGNGAMIWEWFDEQLSFSDKQLIEALANAKSAKMKFIGRQYHSIRNISKKQIKDIKNTLELYRAMGGDY